MTKEIYCVGKINKNEKTLRINDKLSNNKNSTSNSKRIDIVTIKLVKEKSILYNIRKIANPVDAANLLKQFIENSDREQLVVCALDTKNQPTSINIASIGTLNSSLVHPREIFKSAILGNAASIIIAHNHPSGITDPSKEDIDITIRLKEAGKILGIDLLDHIIIANEKYTSLKDKGIL